MKTIFKHTLLSLALLAGAFTAQAQVKIGTAPTTIAPTSNLEVQAGNGKKVIVDKAAGTLQVENLPTGVPSNKIVVADPTGVLKQVDPSAFGGFINKSAKMHAEGPVQHLPDGVYPVQILFTNVDFDNLGGIANTTTSKFVIPQDGWYSYSFILNLHPTTGYTAGYGSNWQTVVKKNGTVTLKEFSTEMLVPGSATYSHWEEVLEFKAGDEITLHGSGCQNACGTYDWFVNQASMTVKREF